MDFVSAIKSGFSKYATFSGRASRSEYWFWILFAFLVIGAGGIVDEALLPNVESGLLAPLIALALLLPNIAVAVRRLQDLDRSGWWLLIYFTGIGAIVLLVWFCMKGTTGSNRFGADPLGG
jgi:uncharacterized membrane protein YhaH (DUF805 family)